MFYYFADAFSKYAWVAPLNYKKGITTTNAFKIILNKSRPSPKQIWADKGSDVYNRSMKLMESN